MSLFKFFFYDSNYFWPLENIYYTLCIYFFLYQYKYMCDVKFQICLHTFIWLHMYVSVICISVISKFCTKLLAHFQLSDWDEILRTLTYISGYNTIVCIFVWPVNPHTTCVSYREHRDSDLSAFWKEDQEHVTYDSNADLNILGIDWIMRF